MTDAKRSGLTSRDLTTMTFIVLTVAGAASMMLFGPAQASVGEAHAELQEANRSAQAAPTLLVESAAWQVTTTRSKAMRAHIAKHSANATDSAALTQTLYDIAAQNGLELTRIQPSSGRQLASIAASAKEDPAAVTPTATLRVALDTTAPYDAVVTFLEALERDLGFVRLESVRLTPVTSDGAPLVRAIIESVHFAFDPEAVEPRQDTEMAGLTTAMPPMTGGAH